MMLCQISSNAAPQFRRLGISLVEVLISMFVLLLGLMGVAAMFPVGSFYVNRAEQLDRGSALGQSAVSETIVRGMIDIDRWRWPDANPVMPIPHNGEVLIDQLVVHGFAIDPLGMFEIGTPAANGFPSESPDTPFARVQLSRFAGSVSALSPSFPQPQPVAAAAALFQSRDDLSFIRGEASDESSRLLFEQSDTGAAVRRQSKGEFSWLVTVAPVYKTFVFGNQPPQIRPITGIARQIRVRDPNAPPNDAVNTVSPNSFPHSVSAVVFHRRDYEEHEVTATILSPSFGGGEVSLQSSEEHDLEEIRSNEWLLIYGRYVEDGIRPLPEQRWFTAWYEITSVDELKIDDESGAFQRFVSLRGPDWPWQVGTVVRAGVFHGAISVFEQIVHLGNAAAWLPPQNAGSLGMPRQP